MANLFSGKINTQEKYIDLEELAEVTLTPETVYLIQAIGACTFCVATSEPTDGGFTTFNDQVARFKLKAGEKMYVKTYDRRDILINLAE